MENIQTIIFSIVIIIVSTFVLPPILDGFHKKCLNSEQEKADKKKAEQQARDIADLRRRDAEKLLQAEEERRLAEKIASAPPIPEYKKQQQG